MANWSNELEMEFLKIYKGEPVLWDPKHPDHRDRSKVHDAWGRISEVLKIPVADLKKKKDSLMATFRMYRRKIKSSEANDSWAEDTYKPIWFAFDLMYSFLGEGLVWKTNRNAATEVQERNETLTSTVEVKQEHVERELNINSTNNGQLPEPTRAQTVPAIRRRRHPPELLEARHTMSEALSTLKKVLLQEGSKHQQEEDECDLYGRMLAKKLRRLPDHERLRFMHEIDGKFIRHLSANTPVLVPSATVHWPRSAFSSSSSEPSPID